MGCQLVGTVKILKKRLTKVDTFLQKKLLKILRKYLTFSIFFLKKGDVFGNGFLVVILPKSIRQLSSTVPTKYGTLDAVDYWLSIEMIVYVTRKEHFNAAHRVYNPMWSDEKNNEVFGICANPNFHGHNFELIVTIKGPINPETGFVVDMKHLGKMMKDSVIDKVDHRNLNLDVGFMQGIIPSCENFVLEIWRILEVGLHELAPHAKLHYIKLIETPKNYVEYYGE